MLNMDVCVRHEEIMLMWKRSREREIEREIEILFASEW